MADIVILITDGNPGTGKLTLNENVKATAGDKIIWRVEEPTPPPPRKIAAITNIVEKSDSDPQLFSVRPAPNPSNPLEWTATIDPNLQLSCSVFSYLIEWRTTAGGQLRTHDPIIAIKPGTSLFPYLAGGFAGLLLGLIPGIVLWKHNRFLQ